MHGVQVDVASLEHGLNGRQQTQHAQALGPGADQGDATAAGGDHGRREQTNHQGSRGHRRQIGATAADDGRLADAPTTGHHARELVPDSGYELLDALLRLLKQQERRHTAALVGVGSPIATSLGYYHSDFVARVHVVQQVSNGETA